MKKQKKIITLCDKCAVPAAARGGKLYSVKNAMTKPKDSCEYCRSGIGLKMYII